MKMLRWMVCITLLDRIRNDDIHERFGIAAIADKPHESCLPLYGHVMHAGNHTVYKISFDLIGKAATEGVVKRPAKHPLTNGTENLSQTLSKMDDTPV